MKVALKLFMIGLVLAGLGAALVPWTIGGTHVRSNFATQIERATGGKAGVIGRITVKLLPRPRVQIARVTIDDGQGGFEIDSAGLYGDIDVSALVKGRWRLSSATLMQPTILLDLQRLHLPSQAMPIPAGPADPLSGSAAFRLALRSGVIRIRSARLAGDTLMTDVSATAEQSFPEGGLTLAGHAVWHGTTAQFTARIEHAAALLRGEPSGASLQLVSPLGAFIASGDLLRSNDRQFVGHVAMSSPSMPALLRAFDLDPPRLTVGRAMLSGDAVATLDSIALANARLRLDQNAFEGTLAFRTEAGMPMIEGTLATDRLDLDTMLGSLKTAQDVRLWALKSFDAGSYKTNVDLRISAEASRIGPFDFEDSALSILLRNGQMELSLDEARAFAGIIKARTLARIGDHGLEGHAEISLSGIDLGSLSNALSGQERISGALTGHVVLDGHGADMKDVVHSLSGQGQVTVEGGNFMGLSVTQALRRFSRNLPLGVYPSGQITTFDMATSTFNVEDGVVNIAEGHVSGPGMQLQFGGRTDLQGGKIQLKAVAAATDAEGSVTPGAPRLPFEMRGILGGPYMLVEHSTGVEMPDFQLPYIDPPHVMR